MLFVDFLINITSDVFSDWIKDRKKEKQIQKEILNYVEHKKDENGRYSIQSEYDYAGFYEFCRDYLLDDIRKYITSQGEYKETVKKRIKQKAINVSNTKYNLANNNISRYIEDLLNIVYSIYRESANAELQLLTGEIEEKIHNNTERIMSELQRFSNTASSQNIIANEEIVAIIATRKKWALNQVIFPWFHDSKKYFEVFPQLFVKPFFHENKNTISYDSFLGSDVSSISILGTAGAGKSTLLRYIFAFSELNNIESVYFTAKEIKHNFPYLSQLNNYCKSSKRPFIVMIDGIDEAFYNNYYDYEEFIINLKSFSHLYFWLGCRTDFYSTYFNEQLSFIEHNYSINPWNNNQIENFINEYSKISGVSNIPAIIEQLIGSDAKLKDIKKNPFHLALLVYLTENNEDEPVLGVYNLYERFFQKWLQNEKKRGTSPDENAEIINSLKKAAQRIYDGREWRFDRIAINNSAVRNLLSYVERESSRELYAIGFYHRSLATFLLAESVFETFKERNCSVIKEVLSHKLKDDVTNFIGDRFSHMTESEKTVLYNNLKYAYFHIAWSNATLNVHEQIVYFVTRLGIDVSGFLLRVINNKRQSANPIMRLTLAYGCVLSENKKVRDFAIEYARSIANESMDASINRGWTVIYFGDVLDRDPYSYLDDEQRSWNKAREARIKRFTKKQPRKKDVRFWLFDIPLFYSFLNNRGWNDISKDEYEILKRLSFSREYFNDAEIDFLSRQHQKLLQEYSKHLQDHCEDGSL